MSIPLILAICRWASSLQTEIDLVIRSCKLDMSYIYKTANGARWKMTAVDEGNKDDDGWASCDCRMSSLGFDAIAATIFMVCLVLLFSYGCIVGGFLACIRYIVDYPMLSSQLILVVMLIGSLVATQLLYIASHMIRFDYKANGFVSFHLTTSLLLTVTYDHLNGYNCRMTPIVEPPKPQPVVVSEDERAKKNYDILVAVQWQLLCNKYKVVESPKQYLRLDEDDFGVHNPLFPPNRDKLVEMGYSCESIATSYCLKFNGEEAHRKRFIDAQVNMLLTKYLAGPKLKQCIDVDLVDIDDVNEPLFPSVIQRLQDSGFAVVHRIRTIDDRVVRQLQLRFVYVPK